MIFNKVGHCAPFWWLSAWLVLTHMYIILWITKQMSMHGLQILELWRQSPNNNIGPIGNLEDHTLLRKNIFRLFGPTLFPKEASFTYWKSVSIVQCVQHCRGEYNVENLKLSRRCHKGCKTQPEGKKLSIYFSITKELVKIFKWHTFIYFI